MEPPTHGAPLNEDDPSAITRYPRPGGEASHASPDDQEVGRLAPSLQFD
jgi:hypothetical protein